jgi:hypothetical protein
MNELTNEVTRETLNEALVKVNFNIDHVSNFSVNVKPTQVPQLVASIYLNGGTVNYTAAI